MKFIVGTATKNILSQHVSALRTVLPPIIPNRIRIKKTPPIRVTPKLVCCGWTMGKGT
jgi:hypothetical protein